MVKIEVGDVISFKLGGKYTPGDVQPGKQFKMPVELFSEISIFIIEEAIDLEDGELFIKAKRVE